MKSNNFIKQIIGKTVDTIYQVDYNENKANDNYLPWTFFITFTEYDKFIEIEGDFDGDHIKINLNQLSELNQKLKKNDLRNEPHLWQVYKVKENESLGKLLNKPILKCEYGIEKDEFIINENKVKGQKEVFTFIRFYYEKSFLTIFEGGCGLSVSNDKNIKLNFEETFDKYLEE
ncbi:hypothetical protein [Psychroserpens jangbogonensis]|uniref:hypothetical protein n=1 Tax=Psychroserpens jangbogonensis TaxID=1484460 RepID=UPI00053D900E|nr:hypothetical protein [Psychroserpens jangbogonensis]